VAFTRKLTFAFSALALVLWLWRWLTGLGFVLDTSGPVSIPAAAAAAH